MNKEFENRIFLHIFAILQVFTKSGSVRIRAVHKNSYVISGIKIHVFNLINYFRPKLNVTEKSKKLC